MMTKISHDGSHGSARMSASGHMRGHKGSIHITATALDRTLCTIKPSELSLEELKCLQVRLSTTT